MEGHPVWSSADNSQITATESRYDYRLSFPPLSGWWASRCFSSRLVLFQESDLPTDQVNNPLGDFEYGTITDVQDKGEYVLARRLVRSDSNCEESQDIDNDFWEWRQYFKDTGDSRILKQETIEYGTSYSFFLVAPGDSTWAMEYVCTYNEDVTNNTCIVGMYDIAEDVEPTLQWEETFTGLGRPEFIELDGDLDGWDGSYWPDLIRFIKHDKEDKILVSDLKESAYLVNILDGSFEVVSAEEVFPAGCRVSPRTDTSRVSSSGLLLEVGGEGKKEEGKVRTKSSSQYGITSYGCP